jgi:hypothetical protein
LESSEQAKQQKKKKLTQVGAWTDGRMASASTQPEAGGMSMNGGDAGSRGTGDGDNSRGARTRTSVSKGKQQKKRDLGWGTDRGGQRPDARETWHRAKEYLEKTVSKEKKTKKR